MMGWRSKLIGGDEYEALTGWRRFLNWPAGKRAAIKRRHNKRQRKLSKQDIRHVH